MIESSSHRPTWRMRFSPSAAIVLATCAMWFASAAADQAQSLNVLLAQAATETSEESTDASTTRPPTHDLETGEVDASLENTSETPDEAADKSSSDEPPVSELEVSDIDNPLSPPDTSSPRGTLKSFMENYDAAYRPFYEEREFHLPQKSPARIRVLRTLDGSELPPAQKERLIAEAAVLLYEVLARVDIPPYEEIPDADVMASLPEGTSREWRVPGTGIEIAEVAEGPRAGEYLFTPETLDRIREFYERAEPLAYRPNRMEGLYNRLSYEPGNWIPMRWIERLPRWVKDPIAGQAVWKWVALIGTLGIWFALVWIAHVASASTEEEPRYWRRCLFAIAIMLLTWLMRVFLDKHVILLGLVFDIMDPIMVVAVYFFASVAILNLGAGVAATIIHSKHVDKGSFDANLIAIAGRVVSWLAVVFLFIKGADDLGIPLPAVVASLGVGGLAIGMAARPTLENLIAGVTLYLDKPVRVGEFCQFHDVLGTVEQIGLRSTRIRRWGGNVISVPNSQFAEYQLDNYNDARYIWIRTRLNLRYETTADQLRYVLAKLREMIFAHPKVLSPRVRFVGFGDYSLDVELICYSDTGVWSEWHAIREDIYLRVMEIVEASGTAFAFPSQTTYFARDPGMDEQRSRAAEQQVRDWREQGKLPFPDMTPERLEELKETLDFPPDGSVLRAPEETSPDEKADDKSG